MRVPSGGGTTILVGWDTRNHRTILIVVAKKCNWVLCNFYSHNTIIRKGK